jgi:hypothetical protein
MTVQPRPSIQQECLIPRPPTGPSRQAEPPPETDRLAPQISHLQGDQRGPHHVKHPAPLGLDKEPHKARQQLGDVGAEVVT